MQNNEHIRYEPGEHSPPAVTLGVALQGIILILANSIPIVTIVAIAADDEVVYLAWAVTAAVTISAIMTALQSARIWRIGAGHMLLVGPGAPFVAVCILTVQEAGLATMATLTVISAIVPIAMAAWLYKLRRVITPTVSGAAFMMLAVAAMPIAVDEIEHVQGGHSGVEGLGMAGATLAVAALLSLRASGIWRLAALPVAVAAGLIVAALTGNFDVRQIIDAPWFAPPQFSGWPGFAPIFSGNTLLLLVVFLVVSVIVALKTGNDGTVIQRASSRTPKATDFRRVQGALNADGVGVFLSGVTGTPPATIYLPDSVSLIGFTGVAARDVAWVIGVILAVFALLPKAVALLIAIPAPITGALLLVVLGLLFVEGIRTVIQDGLDQRKTIIIAVSFSLSVGVHGHGIISGVFGGSEHVALTNSVIIGVAAAILMTIYVDLTSGRRRRVQTELARGAMPQIDEFLGDIAERSKWDDESRHRLLAAGEETLLSMLQLRDEYAEYDIAPRLVVVARPDRMEIEMEFIAYFGEGNIEDRLTLMSDQAREPDIDELSFRLLRHYASTVRHRKYYGLDIVNVHVIRRH